MQMSRRGWLAGTFVASMSVPALALAAGTPAAPAAKGPLTDESLGNLLKAMGLQPKLTERRFDFAFKSNIDEQEWELSMSAVMSLDGQSIWLMAWLDELPKSAADVPRTALLRLLAENDKLGSGKAFAYVASNRRFVLQRTLPNQDLSTATFHAALTDLGASVVATYPYWSVANWRSQQGEDDAPKAPTTQIQGSQPKPTAAAARPTQTVINDSKFLGPVRK